MYHIRKNAHTNLIYSIQTDISDSWGLEGGGFSFISIRCCDAVYN